MPLLLCMPEEAARSATRALLSWDRLHSVCRKLGCLLSSDTSTIERRLCLLKLEIICLDFTDSSCQSLQGLLAVMSSWTKGFGKSMPESYRVTASYLGTVSNFPISSWLSVNLDRFFSCFCRCLLKLNFFLIFSGLAVTLCPTL